MAVRKDWSSFKHNKAVSAIVTHRLFTVCFKRGRVKMIGVHLVTHFRFVGTGTTKFYGIRQSEELAEDFAQGVATEYAVKPKITWRELVAKLARMSKAATLGRIFTALGVVADGIFFGISVYDLYQDFTADNLGPWKIADDVLFAASAGVGAALGVVRPRWFLWRCSSCSSPNCVQEL
ncbi:hypothetical protein OS493_011855 [Desmophyllum pertusum]|uniref:Uncharacterized protein n=1 Tax=Desmophyllum pertusum TaxID=174260 RepID=A0A9X0CFV8_9CNID|nr:hypothetical protein OS493_011855 [Desmophyllum pertusum]